MKVVFLTIVLDGQPFIASHYWQWAELKQFPWEWRVVEGVAAPEKDTYWVRPMPPRLSNDGTTRFLDSLAAFDSRVILFRKAIWPGKTAMLNEALKTIDEPCLLVEVDSDERWTFHQIRTLHRMFEQHPEKNAAYFRCRYFLGRDIAITNTDGEHFGNNHAYEWLRAWKISPGARFETHEPPKMAGMKLNAFNHAETEKQGLVFDHFAYATEAQVKFKEEYYGSPNNLNGTKYSGAVAKWKALQANAKWPVTNLAEFMPWVGQGVQADKV